MSSTTVIGNVESPDEHDRLVLTLSTTRFTDMAAMLNGALPNGALPNGALPNGALPNGALPNGALPNGCQQS